MPRIANCQHEDQEKTLPFIIMQASPYQDSKKSRIGTRISAILRLLIMSFSKRLGNAKRIDLPQALMGLLSLPFSCLLLAKFIQLSKGSKMWE